MPFTIRWIGQSGYILDFGDKKLCIDPYLSNSCAKGGKWERLAPVPIEPAKLDVDMVVCSHDHADHVDEETLAHTDTSRIVYAGPDSCVAHFKRIGISEKNTVTLNVGDATRLGDATISAVFAEHSKDSIGMVVRYRGVTMYFVGDSLFSERLVEVRTYSPDILVTCINGKLGNMNYGEAAGLATGLGVKVAIPAHYGMFADNTEDPKNFERELDGSGVKVFELPFDVPCALDDILP